MYEPVRNTVLHVIKHPTMCGYVSRCRSRPIMRRLYWVEQRRSRDLAVFYAVFHAESKLCIHS